MMKRWRDAMLSLSSEAFLDLARTYLGAIRTPFSKQELLDRLAALLRREDVRERIAGLIDPDEAAMLTAVRLLDEPEPSRLMEFLLPGGGTERERAELISRMVNLEERLLLYEYRQEGVRESRLAVTPALESLVDERAFEPALLFPEDDDSSEAAATADDPALARAALASFFLDGERAPKADAQGEPRLGAKLQRAFHAAFPRGPEPEHALESLMEAGVLRREGQSFPADPRAAARFAALGQDASLPVESAGDRDAARAYLSAALEARPALGRTARLRLLMLGGGMDSGSARLLLSSMDGAQDAAGRTASCALDADYSLHARPGTAAADLAVLAVCADLVRLDGAALFRLTRSSAARAFRAGLDAASLGARLEAMTGRPLPQNVAYSLEAWEREHRSLTLVSGIVMLCDERASRFMEASPILKGRIVRALAPGVLLTDFSSRAEAEDALTGAGLATPPALLEGDRSPFPFLPGGGGAGTADQAAHGAIARPRGPRARALPPGRLPALPDFEARRKPPSVGPEGVRAQMEAALKASAPPRELRDALEERLRLKLLVSEAGLAPESVRYEKHEAGGLDYLGKIRLIERACREPSWLLEILHRSPAGEPEILLVRALGLRKSSGGLRLDCAHASRTADSGAAQPLSLAVERISRVKRVRTSIFPSGSA